MAIEKIDTGLTPEGPGQVQPEQWPGAPQPLPEDREPRDKLELSPKTAQPPRTAPIDAPELAFPTLRGLNRGETKRKILEDIKKAKALEGAKSGGGGTLSTNLWMAHPSWMVALMNSEMKLASLISETRHESSQRKQETELKMAEVGIEGSNIGRDEKLAQRDKERLTGIGHAMGAVSATIQLASIPGARGQAKKEAEGSEIGKLRADEKAKLEQMEKDTGLKATDGKPTGKDLTALPDDQQKDLTAQRKKVEKLEMKFQSELDQTLSRKMNQLELHKKIVDGTVNGVLEVQKSLISEHEADLAKRKGLNEVLQQTLNRVNEGTNKSKDEDLASINKIMDTIKQTSEQNQRAFQLKG